MRKLIIFLACCLAVTVLATLIYIKSPSGEQLETASSANETVPCAHGANCSHNHAAYGDSETKRPASRYPMVGLDEPVITGGPESVATAQAGDRLKLNFGADLQLDARVVGSKIFPGNDKSISMKLLGQKGSIYWLKKAGGSIMGNIHLKDGEKNIIYQYNGQDGEWTIQQIAQQEYLCSSGDTDEAVGIPFVDLPYEPDGPVGVIPLLNSLPGAAAVVYIDFDGELVTGTRWNTLEGRPETINAQPAGFDEARILEVWEEVAEDMRPFKINVTTDRTVFDAAAVGKKMMCIVTPTSVAFPGSGGVAFLDSFHDGNNDPCWAFNLTPGSCAQTVSHEVGHTFGLNHDGLLGQAEQEEYHRGNGTWGPSMGAPFGLKVVSWSDGGYVGSTNQEDDLNVIATFSADFRDDLFGDSDGEAFELEAEQPGEESVDLTGVIETPDDVDVFSFSTSGGSVTLNADPEGATIDGTKFVTNMNVRVQLFDEAGDLVIEDDPEDSYAASITANIDPGNYTFHVTGTNSGSPDVSGFSNYGSIGQYGLTGSIPGLGDLEPPTADLVSPANGDTVDLAALNAQRYLEVTFTDTDAGVDEPSIDGDELSLTGTGVGTAALNIAPTLVSGTTYRYGFTGNFTEGDVDVEFVAGSFGDRAGTPNLNVAETESFTIEVMPFFRIVDDGDVGFSTTEGWSAYPGNRIISGYNTNFTYKMAGNGSEIATWTFEGLPSGDYDVAITWHEREFYRASDAPYEVFDGTVTQGSSTIDQRLAPSADRVVGGEPFQVVFSSVTINSGTLVVKLSDAAGDYVIADAVRIELPTPLGPDVTPPAANLSNPADGNTIDLSELNARRYLEVNFFDFGDGLDTSSIDGDELQLNGTGAAGVTLSGAPTVVSGTTTYRYDFTGDFVEGDVDVTFKNKSFADLANPANENVAITETFTVTNPPPPPFSQIIDDADAGFTATAGWSNYAGNRIISGYNTNFTFAPSGAGNETATWTFTGLAPGDYQIAITWHDRGIYRATNARYEVLDGATSLAFGDVNQQTAPTGGPVVDGEPFEVVFASVNITTGTLVVELSDAADDYIIADAVRVELVVP